MQALQSRRAPATFFRQAREQNLLNDFEREEKVARYQRLLGSADWFHEACDNHEAYLAGRAQFTVLHELQPEVDPDGTMWRAAAPESMTSGVLIPQPRARRSA